MNFKKFYVTTFLLILGSCKGDYDCVCTYYGTTQSALSYYDIQRAYAKESCGFYQDQLSDPDGKCKLEKKK
jgi:hypothetical protein